MNQYLFKYKLSITFWLILFVVGLGYGQKDTLSQRVSNYKIDVKFDNETKMLFADQTLEWTNPSEDMVEYLYFHLYYNAFKNSNSTFFTERGFPNILPKDEDGECSWSWSKILSIKDELGVDLVDYGEYVQPDDDNANDQTVWRVKLRTPVNPHEQVKYEMTWQAKMPKVMPRTGYNKDFHFFAQWFPKLGVYEPAGMRYADEGGWNCHQYHSSGEFYADFGTYDVHITVPSDFVLGASGQLIEKKSNNNETTWHFQANDVIDFAWAASPQFEVQKSLWKDINLAVITYPNHLDCNKKYFETAYNVLEYMHEHVGDYPYPNLTIVDPPIHGIFTGGMEYPNLVTSLSLCFLPTGVKSTQTLTTHELIHQYFMQMVASNEYEEPWLDEGLTTYYEGRIMDHYYGKDKSFVDWMGLKIGNGAYNRWEYLSRTNPKIADNTLSSSEYVHGGYSTIAYNKTAVWLKTLEGIVGIEIMDKMMRSYFKKWKFKHPSRKDFIAALNEVSISEGLGDLDWFFEQTLFSSDLCDYLIADISNDPVQGAYGFLTDEDDCQSLNNVLSENSQYTSTVIIHRVGEVKLPNEVLIHFDDGREELYHWDGQARSHEISFTGTAKIVGAQIDPNYKIYLDANFTNNSFAVEHDLKGIYYYISKAFIKTQEILQSVSLFI